MLKESSTGLPTSRFREFVVPIILLVYGFSHLYHILHLRIRCAGGTFPRQCMEAIQGPMILMRAFGPYIIVIPIAIWVLKTGIHRRLNAIMLVVALGCGVISWPYAYRIVSSMSRDLPDANITLSAHNILVIDTACSLYAKKNNGEYPPALADLVQQGYLSAKSLVNPRRPEQKLGYVYIRPTGPLGTFKQGLSRIMVYEVYEEWGEGINVGFVDGKGWLMKDEEQFKKLLAQPRQTSPAE